MYIINLANPFPLNSIDDLRGPITVHAHL